MGWVRFTGDDVFSEFGEKKMETSKYILIEVLIVGISSSGEYKVWVGWVGLGLMFFSAFGETQMDTWYTPVLVLIVGIRSSGELD